MRYFILLLLLFFHACSSKVGTIYQKEENLLRTKGKSEQFHSVVYYPNAINLDFKGYIVGVEKAPKHVVKKYSKMHYNLSNKSKGVRYKMNFFKNKTYHTLFISHIIRFDGCNKKTKFLYNIYGNEKKYIFSAYDKGFEALNRLRADLKKQLKGYDSIIIFVMGWNTSQEEAIRDFKALYKNMMSFCKGVRKPLFIGVTWPSEWDSSILPDFIVKALSFPVKADDADELGLTWLGALIHYGLKDVRVPIYVVGHSFGARAATMAVFEGNILYLDKPYPKRSVDTLIALQGAFSVRRFLKGGIEGIEHDISNVKQIVLTSSKYDFAMDSAFWSNAYAGDDKSFKKFCKNNSKFLCATYTKDYHFEFTRASKIIYLNCDSIIKNRAYMSAGGAHSDIYDKEMGQFLCKVLQGVK